jgi:hypothetical protein
MHVKALTGATTKAMPNIVAVKHKTEEATVDKATAAGHARLAAGHDGGKSAGRVVTKKVVEAASKHEGPIALSWKQHKRSEDWRLSGKWCI